MSKMNQETKISPKFSETVQSIRKHPTIPECVRFKHALKLPKTFNIQPTDNSPTEIVPVGTTYSWSAPVSNPVGAVTGGLEGASQASISQTLTLLHKLT